MMRAHLAAAAVLGSLLAACGQPQVDRAKPAGQDAAKDTVFKEMVETQDKARAVQDTAAQHQQQVEQALEQAEGR